MTRPNILFITADQWRGECLGVAGHPLVRTPHLDALAAEGTAFLNHYANAPPAYAAEQTQTAFLEADPDNLVNLAGKPEFAAVQLALAQELLSWRARHLDQTLALKELTPQGVVSVSVVR